MLHLDVPMCSLLWVLVDMVVVPSWVPTLGWEQGTCPEWLLYLAFLALYLAFLYLAPVGRRTWCFQCFLAGGETYLAAKYAIHIYRLGPIWLGIRIGFDDVFRS